MLTTGFTVICKGTPNTRTERPLKYMDNLFRVTEYIPVVGMVLSSLTVYAWLPRLSGKIYYLPCLNFEYHTYSYYRYGGSLYHTRTLYELLLYEVELSGHLCRDICGPIFSAHPTHPILRLKHRSAHKSNMCHAPISDMRLKHPPPSPEAPLPSSTCSTLARVRKKATGEAKKKKTPAQDALKPQFFKF